EHIIQQHLIPILGNIALVQLKPHHLQSYYAEKLVSGRRDGQGGLSPRTVRHHHVTLHDALQSAVKWGLLARNPADTVDAPRYQRRDMQTLDESELQVFLEAARSTPYHALFYTLLFSGLRRSEALALRWADVDVYLAQVSVSRSFHHLRDGRTVFRAPKTAKGRRLVALPPSAALVLRDHREKQESEMSVVAGRALAEEDLVFAQPDGKPLLPDTVTHAWVKLARRTGFKVRLHDARHIHASLLFKQNVPAKVVQERLGHATIATTMDIYSHVAPGMQEAAALRFDEGMAQARPRESSSGVVGTPAVG
ncbi:MAG: tyrosine-type recombinase/integrase, partial [Candidatus Methylomirabilales bacterium]